MSKAATARYSCPLHPYDHDRSCCDELGVHTPVRGRGRKDLWNYTHSFSERDKVQIKSRRHFERECAKRGRQWVVKDELFTRGEPNRPEPKPIDRKKVLEVASDVVKSARQLERNGVFNKLSDREVRNLPAEMRG
jgi:hypothetical protein